MLPVRVAQSLDMVPELLAVCACTELDYVAVVRRVEALHQDRVLPRLRAVALGAVHHPLPADRAAARCRDVQQAVLIRERGAVWPVNDEDYRRPHQRAGRRRDLRRQRLRSDLLRQVHLSLSLSSFLSLLLLLLSE
eukprot:COSAG03_NODE_1925_length_3351_cov_1.838561_4_plen_135_part_01